MTTSIFTPAQLQQVIAETLPADAKPGEKIVVGTVDQDGAKVVAVMKLKSVWEVQTAFKADWHGDVSAGASIIGRWQ